MFLKLSRAGWLFSALAMFATLIYVYAGLPQEQVLIQEAEDGPVYITREQFFYISLAFYLLVNVLVFIICAIQRDKAAFRGWFYGLIICLNIFMILACLTLNVINSAEKYDFSRIGYFLYGSLGLILLWCITWPLWALYQKISAKGQP
jgi:hypothetical protein